MAEKDANRPYSLDDLLNATSELQHAKAMLKDKQNTLKRHRDAIASFEKEEAAAHQEVQRREIEVRKIAAHLDKK